MVDCCEGGTTPRTTSGFGSNPPRTGNLAEQVGTTDIRCRCLHPITPNKQVCGFSSRFQHRMHGGEHSIDGPNIRNKTASHTEQHHPSQEHASKTTITSGRSHVHQKQNLTFRLTQHGR